jgi:hypothetical protein
MGNETSAPSTSSASPPPPPVSICDLDCQKQKDLALLKSALDNTSQTLNPEKYEQARIAYYTALNGQAWLAKEKERLAKLEVEPMILDYSTQYNALKAEQESQSVFTSMANALKMEESNDQEDNAFLNKQLNKEKTRTETLLRLNELGSSSPTSWIPILFDFGLVLLGLAVLFLLYSKMDKIKGMLGYSNGLQTLSGNV